MQTEPIGDMAIVRGKSLAEATVDALRSAIISGRYAVGRTIPQASVGRELGVSQGPVRDALAVLEREGLVRRTPTNRMVVARLTRRDIEELLAVRSVLEVTAVKLAIQHATGDDLERLERNVAAAAKAKSNDELIELETQFHELILEAGQNRQLLRHWKLMAPQLKVLMRRMVELPNHSRQTAVRAHGRLFDLIRRRAEDRAVRFVATQMDELKEEALRRCADE